MEKAKHKQQRLNLEKKKIVKDYILQNCPWFHKFEDIFHKRSIISLSILIKLEELACYDRINIYNSKLKKVDFNLKETLEVYRKLEDTEWRL